jgi:ribose transport system substrate-binding protein
MNMRMTNLRGWMMLGLLAAVGIFAGCKKADVASTGDQASPAKKSIRIGMVAKSESNDVFQAAKVGAMDAAKELSDKYNINITIDWRTPPDEDAAKQAEAISALANEHVDGITVSCSDARTLTGAINDAVDKGVPVVCFDSDAPDSKRLCVYGTDDVECGQLIMAQLAKFMNQTGTVAILAGNESAPNLQARVRAIRDELKKYPNMHELNGDGNGAFYHEETPEKAVEALSAAMTANPGKIDGWAFVGGWPLFTDHALNFPPGTVKVVSCDALPKQLDYLRDGHVQMLVAQDCYGWGHRTVEILVDKIVNQKDPPAVKIPNPLKQVTKDNVDQFATYWDKWLKK